MGSRREFLKGAIIGGVGATSSLIGGQLIANTLNPHPAEPISQRAGLTKTQRAFQPLGKHQPGIESEPLAMTTLLALDIKGAVTTDQMRSWMTILADDIDRLMEHREMLADPQPELSLQTDSLAIVVGFGPSLFKKLALEDRQPEGFGELPAFKIDRLAADKSHGDVLIMISSDSSLQSAHVERSLLRDSSYFAKLKWRQTGFSSVDPNSPLGSQRNLMGQIDGTGSARIGTDSFTKSVWGEKSPSKDSPTSWYAGGTTLVYRKIEMNLETWDILDRKSKENTIGRTLANGAPLGGKNETDFLDLNARGENGFHTIPDFAHVRRAQSAEGSLPLFRKPYNYLEELPDQSTRAGLVWLAYAHNAEKQYVPIQRKLAEFDLLNKWTTPIASAIFAIPRGRVKVSDPLCGGLFNA